MDAGMFTKPDIHCLARKWRPLTILAVTSLFLVQFASNNLQNIQKEELYRMKV
jgi:hypothetical protein